MAVESSVFNSMAEMDYEGAREFLERKDEHEKLYNSIIKKKDKETSKEKIENNFDSLEKWKEDMNRNLQQMEARLKIKREFKEREEREIKKHMLKNFRELLKNSNENKYSSDRVGRIK